MGLSSILKEGIPIASDIANLVLNRNESKKNRDMQREFKKMGVQWLAQDARAAGISPLAALGHITSYSPTAVMNDVGRNTVEMLKNRPTKIDRELTDIQKQQEIISLDKSRIERDIMQKQLDGLDTGDTSNEFGIEGQAKVKSNSLYKDVELPTSGQPGVQKGIPPLNIFSVDQHGKMWKLPSQQATEALESSWFDNFMYGTQQAIDVVRAARARFGVTKNDREYRNYMDKVLRPKLKNPKLEARWNVKKSGWVVRQKVGGHSQLFDYIPKIKKAPWAQNKGYHVKRRRRWRAKPLTQRR